MPEQNKKLTDFMKKQISEKSTKKTSKNPASSKKNNDKNQDKSKQEEGEKDSGEEEMTEEEKVEDAKKASRNKAAERDQTEMIKKLIMENAVKYIFMFSMLVILAIGIIEFGPALMHSLNGLLYKVLMGALNQK